jgi:UDP-glucose 4-epimerase
MPRVLITGGAGFIGANLVGHLKATGGYDIVVLDDETLGSRTQLTQFGIEFIKADILDEAALDAALRGVDIVVHLAADSRVIDSLADPARNFRINVMGTFALLQRARAAGIKRFVNASTGGAILGEAMAPIREDMPARPASPYGASKLAGEGYCSAFRQAYGLPTISLRFSNIYGPYSRHKRNVVAQFFKSILKGEDLIVHGDGSQVRDYLFVGDLVDGIEKAMLSDVGDTVQLASGRPTTINELIEMIRKTVGSGHPVRVRHEAFRTGEIRTTWCNIDVARSMNFDPRTSLEDGLRQTWQWFMNVYS